MQAVEDSPQGWQYIVLEIVNTRDERLLRVLSTGNKSEVTIHLRDAWVHTLLREGDVVNLVADVEEHDGGLHAICDCSKGALLP